MNWGKGIVIGMVTFMGFITFLVVSLMMNKVDLQSEDYYKREINFEQEITAMENSNGLEAKIEVVSQDQFVLVKVPEKGNFSNIQLDFIRPDDQKLDKKYQIIGTKTFLIDKSELKKGNYSIEISYKFDKKPCLQRETISI